MNKTEFLQKKAILDSLYETNNISGIEWYEALSKLIEAYEEEKQ